MIRAIFASAALALFALPAHSDLFVADSKRLSDAKMDIVIAEIERLPRISVLDIQIKARGSSVGASFFLLCSVRNLARERGKGRYVAKVEGQPKRGQMLLGFLTSPEETPETLDPRLAGQKAIDLEQFASVCERMK
jgi:hypothetical protein